MKNNFFLIQLNEINFNIAFKYSKKYNFKNINKLYENKLKNYTTSSENNYSLLEPWIQWVSFYTGLSANDHGIYRLGDITQSNKELIFEKIENKGFHVGAICPMNAKNNLKRPKYFIPDPWTDTKSDHTYWSKLIHRLISKLVNKNANNSISFKDIIYLLLIFLKFVRLKNYFKMMSLALTSFKFKWRKAIFLDILLNEIHLYLFKKNKPDLSSIFLNAGAHIQHHYFFHSEFHLNPLKKIHNNLLKDPLFEVLKSYDSILGDYINLNSSYLILTGLTQSINPNPKYYYRLKDHKNFLDLLKIKFKKILPRMSRDFVIEFDNSNDASSAEKILSNIFFSNFENKKLFDKIDNRGKSLFVTLTYPNKINKDDKIVVNNKLIDIFDKVVFVAIKNGIHDPRGYFFISKNLDQYFKKNELNVKDFNEVISKFFI
tara:strand:- start:4873 stop:6165 length:1293 start_codon:yes stop_codon:yes gene_type:complete